MLSITGMGPAPLEPPECSLPADTHHLATVHTSLVIPKVGGFVDDNYEIMDLRLFFLIYGFFESKNQKLVLPDG